MCARSNGISSAPWSSSARSRLRRGGGGVGLRERRLAERVGERGECVAVPCGGRDRGTAPRRTRGPRGRSSWRGEEARRAARLPGSVVVVLAAPRRSSTRRKCPESPVVKNLSIPASPAPQSTPVIETTSSRTPGRQAAQQQRARAARVRRGRPWIAPNTPSATSAWSAEPSHPELAAEWAAASSQAASSRSTYAMQLRQRAPARARQQCRRVATAVEQRLARGAVIGAGSRGRCLPLRGLGGLRGQLVLERESEEAGAGVSTPCSNSPRFARARPWQAQRAGAQVDPLGAHRLRRRRARRARHPSAAAGRRGAGRRRSTRRSPAASPVMPAAAKPSAAIRGATPLAVRPGAHAAPREHGCRRAASASAGAGTVARPAASRQRARGLGQVARELRAAGRSAGAPPSRSAGDRPPATARGPGARRAAASP